MRGRTVVIATSSVPPTASPPTTTLTLMRPPNPVQEDVDDPKAHREQTAGAPTNKNLSRLENLTTIQSILDKIDIETIPDSKPEQEFDEQLEKYSKQWPGSKVWKVTTIPYDQK